MNYYHRKPSITVKDAINEHFQKHTESNTTTKDAINEYLSNNSNSLIYANSSIINKPSNEKNFSTLNQKKQILTAAQNTNPSPAMPERPVTGIEAVPTPPTESALTYIRFFHAMINTEGIDIYINDEKVVSDLRYGTISEYFNLPANNYNIKVYETGEANQLYINADISLRSNLIYVGAIVGAEQHGTIDLISDIKRIKNLNLTNIRFVNLSPTIKSYDIYIDDIKVISSILFEEVSNYVELRPGTYSITFKDTETGEIVLFEPNVELNPGIYYVLYEIGAETFILGIQDVIDIEGTTYLEF